MFHVSGIWYPAGVLFWKLVNPLGNGDSLEEVDHENQAAEGFS